MTTLKVVTIGVARYTSCMLNVDWLEINNKQSIKTDKARTKQDLAVSLGLKKPWAMVWNRLNSKLRIKG